MIDGSRGGTVMMISEMNGMGTWSKYKVFLQYEFECEFSNYCFEKPGKGSMDIQMAFLLCVFEHVVLSYLW